MRLADFNFALPDELIAQSPASERDQSRLLVLDRASGRITHCSSFRQFPTLLHSGDLLVLNDTRVMPARLRGRKVPSGGQVEVLLAEQCSKNNWWVMLRPGKRVRPGTRVTFAGAGLPWPEVEAVVQEKKPEGQYRLLFSGVPDIVDALESIGEVPLPPYIARRPTGQDQARYQTVFAREIGSVAAPTAGLHFTEELLSQVKRLGIEVHYVTLHVGFATFAPVKVERLEEHGMHEEWFALRPETASAINAARQSGRRILAVGTTTVRVLESVARENEGRLVGMTGRTRIFIHPPFRFRVADALLTNFHLPQSTLLMLVSAFAAPGETRGRDMILAAYAEAIREHYRFFSYGDAMLIL